MLKPSQASQKIHKKQNKSEQEWEEAFMIKPLFMYVQFVTKIQVRKISDILF